ncbi:MAG: rhomboid family intramembrane serine protease [Bacteroidia bacterium]
MSITEMLTGALIIGTAVMTYQGLNKAGIMQRYAFQVGPIRDGKEYIRLLSSGFLHVHWPHFLMNMLTLFFFHRPIGHIFGAGGFLLIYFGAMIGGGLIALYFRRNDSMYSAVGASGAVNGILFAFILAAPFSDINLYLVIPIPTWIYGIAYLGYTLYGIKSRLGNIGHEAHLGGAIVGMLLGMALQPALCFQYWYMVILLLGPVVAFFYLSIYKPEILRLPGMGSPAKKSGGQYWSRNYSRASAPGRGREAYTKKVIDLKPGSNKNKNMSPQEELDMLLDKVRIKGMNKLSKQEKKRLEELSKGLG